MGARWKGDLTLKFVQLYKLHQCLWNPNHVDFRNRHARCLSLAAIEEEIGPQHFMHVPIQKKIKNLKNTYVQEKKKIIEITSKGYSYEPQVRWFHEFHECMLQSGADGLSMSIERELKNETHKYEALVGGSGPLESSLHLRLAEHLNSEVALGTVQDVSQCVQWVRSTFFHVRAASDPRKYLSLAANAPNQQITKKIEELCVRAMNRLATSGLISMDEASCIQATEAGKLMSMYCLDFETMKLIMKVKGSESLEDILNLVCESHELSEMHLRVDERRCLNMLNRNNAGGTIRFPMKGKISNRQMKVNCIIQAILGCLPIPDPSLNQESMKIMRTADRVCKCLVAYITRVDFIAGRPNYFTAILTSIVLGKCIIAHLWENSPFVSRQLKGIGPALSNLLASAGKTTFMLLEESHPRDLERILNRGPPNGNIIRKQVSLLPKYQLQADLMDTRTVVIKVVMLNHALLASNVDNLTAGENHKTHVIVGDASNHILMCKLFKDKDLIGMYNGEIQYTVERILKDEHVISIQCISDSFVGIDVSLTFTFPGIWPGTNSTKSALIFPTTSVIPRKQASITDTFKIKKRRAETVSDEKKMCKKQKDCSVIEKLKALKESFVMTTQAIKEDFCEVENILNDENSNKFCEIPISDRSLCASEKRDNNKGTPCTNDTQVKELNRGEIEDNLLKFDSGDIKENEIENLLQQIEKEINSTAKSDKIRYDGSQINDKLFHRQQKCANQKLKSQIKSRKSFISDPYQKFSYNRSQDDDELEQRGIKTNTDGFATNIKDNLSKYLHDTKLKAETNGISSTIIPDLLLNTKSESVFLENQFKLLGNTDEGESVNQKKINDDSDSILEPTQLDILQSKKNCYSKSMIKQINTENNEKNKLQTQFSNSNDAKLEAIRLNNLKSKDITDSKPESKQVTSELNKKVELKKTVCKRINKTPERIYVEENNLNKVLLQENILGSEDDINTKELTTIFKQVNNESNEKVESTNSLESVKCEVPSIMDLHQSSLKLNPEKNSNLSGLDHMNLTKLNNSPYLHNNTNVVTAFENTDNKTLTKESVYGLGRNLTSSNCSFKIKLIEKLQMEVEIERIITNKTFHSNEEYTNTESITRSLACQQTVILKKVNSQNQPQFCIRKENTYCEMDNIQNVISNPDVSSKNKLQYSSNLDNSLQSHVMNNNCKRWQQPQPNSLNFIRNNDEVKQNSRKETKDKVDLDPNSDGAGKQTSSKITSNLKVRSHIDDKDKTKTVHTILSKYQNKRSRETIDNLESVLNTRSDQCLTSSIQSIKRPFQIKDIKDVAAKESSSQLLQNEATTPLATGVTKISPSTQLLTGGPNSVREITKDINTQSELSEKINLEQVLTPPLEFADNTSKSKMDVEMNVNTKMVNRQTEVKSNLFDDYRNKNPLECSHTYSHGKPPSIDAKEKNKYIPNIEQNIASRPTLNTSNEDNNLIMDKCMQYPILQKDKSLFQERDKSPSNIINIKSFLDIHDSIGTLKKSKGGSFYEPIFDLDKNTGNSNDTPRINSFLEKNMTVQQNSDYHNVSPQKTNFYTTPKISHSVQGYSNIEYDKAYHTDPVVNVNPFEIRQAGVLSVTGNDMVQIRNPEHTRNGELQPFLIDNEFGYIHFPGINVTKKETWLLHPETTIASKRLNHFPFQSETVIRDANDSNNTKLKNFRYVQKDKLRR